MPKICNKKSASCYRSLLWFPYHRQQVHHIAASETTLILMSWHITVNGWIYNYIFLYLNEENIFRNINVILYWSIYKIFLFICTNQLRLYSIYHGQCSLPVNLGISAYQSIWCLFMSKIATHFKASLYYKQGLLYSSLFVFLVQR